MFRSRLSLIVFALMAAGTTVSAVESAKEDTVKSHDHGTWQEKRFVATVDDKGTQQVEIVGGDYYYDPNYIIVKINKPVELRVKKTAGYIPHNLVVHAPEAGIDFKLELKTEVQTVRFTPTKIGTYPIYCDKSMLWFKTHREKGMEGLIEVVK